MSISFHNEKIQFQLVNKVLHKKWVKHWIRAHQKIPGDISFVYTSNEHLKLINQEYLNHNYYTDVICFDYSENERVSGDVFISIEEVKKNAEFYGTDAEDELRRVMIHGVSHLLGFEDGNEEEKEIMRKKENEALHLWVKGV